MNNATLLTIITESALETQLLKHINSLDISGYTITNARGKGSRGPRGASWEANSNIRIEVICSSLLAEKATSLLQELYYDNYAMVIFSSDIQVLRPDKFT